MPKFSAKPAASTPSQLAWVGEHFEQFQKNGQGWKACCPLHDDNKPSLSINEGTDGRVLVKCHAGCPTDGLLGVVGLRMADLMPGAKRIVKTYDYVRANDELGYQNVRFEPKTFKQRQPKDGGGWLWNMDGVERVPYRLPELISADKSRPVFIVEGEKDADGLCALGLTATTNIGGAGKWLAEYNSHFVGCDIVILPDNDTAGWEHAQTVARHLAGVARSIKVVELPGLPPKGDVSDWLASVGTRPLPQLLGLVKRTNPTLPNTQHPTGCAPVGQPVGNNPTGDKNSRKNQGQTRCVNPLGTPVGQATNPLGRVAVPAFPLAALPVLLQRYVESVAAALPCPVDFPGAMMLPVLGTFIGRKRRIAIKPSWTEYPLLWVGAVARSGDRKSPAFEAVTAPLRHSQKTLLAEYYAEVKAWAALPPADQAAIPEPQLKQVLTTDTTIEALKVVLATNPNGVIYPADELSGWARAIGQYKGGRGDDRQIWLSIWSCIQIVVNRKSLPRPLIINDPFVCITGGIQPDALPDIIDDSREDGFSARMLFSYPDPIPSGKWNDDVLENSLDYQSICEQLWDLEPTDGPVTFSAPAKSRWVEWVNAHRAENPADNLRPTWSKAEGHCLRLTLILHLVRQLCNETRSEQIDLPSIDGGIALIEYFKGHASRVYGQLALTTGNDRIPKALRWIRKHGGTVTARLVRQNGICKTSEEAEQLLKDLADLGYGTISNGKQGSQIFTLSPNPQAPAPCHE